MLFDPQRAFPYPVLRPEVDDYVDSEFQTSVELSTEDNQSLTVEAQFSLSVPELNSSIKAGLADFVLVVSCRDTFFRRAFRTRSEHIQEALPPGELRGQVVISPYIVARKLIHGFQCDRINQEFGSGPFNFSEGAVLAIDEPKAIYVDREVFRPITSIFELVSNESLTGDEWRLNLSGEKAQIALSPAMKEQIDRFRAASKANKAILINSIYFAAVMQCLVSLQQDADEYEGKRWTEVIRQQCQNHNLDPESHDAYLLAQRLMKLPTALLRTYVFPGQPE